MIDRHVIVELASSLWVLFHELEEVKIGSESALEGTLLAVGWVGITILLELGRQSKYAGGDAVSPNQ